MGDENIELNCEVMDSNPAVQSFTWVKGDVRGTTQSYVIRNVSMDDHGTYQCTATNEAGTSDIASAVLDVLCKKSRYHGCNATRFFMDIITLLWLSRCACMSQ